MRFQRFIPFLAAFVVPLLGVYAWWGGFNPVDIHEDVVRGPYRYAYLERSGDYSGLPEMQAEVARLLQAQGVAAGHVISVLYSNPGLVSVKERLARTGFLLAADSVVKEPLKVDVIAARPVLLVEVRAAVRLAPSRAYSALDAYLQARGRGIVMPTVEIYEAADQAFGMGRLTVEMAR